MKKKFEKPKKERLTEQIISYLTSEYDEITVVYLFGSFVTGEFFSDIDIGIVTKVNPVKALKFELDLEIRLEKIVGCPVDVRVLNYAPLSFCQNVIRQGTVIIRLLSPTISARGIQCPSMIKIKWLNWFQN
jgi:hypothetical protein